MTLFASCKPLAASIMLLAATQAHATLTSYIVNGQEVVYSSVSDVTWTKNANLLGSMFAGDGVNTVINAILAASPAITNTPNYASPSGTYTLTDNDFNSDGSVTWFGAMAFVNYLNHINFAGNNQWRLPSVVTNTRGYNIPSNGVTAGNEYSELFYQELNGAANNPATNNKTFDNEQMYGYWSGTEYVSSPGTAWRFNTNSGEQDNRGKARQYYAWAVSPGNLTPVPETSSVMMMMAGLGIVSGMTRRRHS